MTQTARKELSRDISQNGMVETVRYAICKKDILTQDEIEALKKHFDDPEHAFLSGLCIDFNEDLIWVDVDNLLVALADYCKGAEEDEKQDYEYIMFNRVLQKLQNFKGYTIWI